MYTINKITALLKEQKRSQSELTDYLGVNKSIFTQWKKGQNNSYLKYLPQLAEFFGVSVSEFFDEGETKNAPVYLDNETRELLDALRKRPEMRTLFKVSKNASKEDVEMAVDIIEKFKKGSRSGNGRESSNLSIRVHILVDSTSARIFYACFLLSHVTNVFMLFHPLFHPAKYNKKPPSRTAAREGENIREP